MNQWPQISLGEIFDIARGGSPRPIDNFITDAEDGVNWVSISDATESAKYINSTKKKIIKEGVSRSRMVHPGDFLLTNSMSFGRPYIMNTSGCIHDGWLVLSKRTENVDQDYFFHLLGSDTTYRKFKALAAGAVVKNLNIDLVKSVTVSLPPLEEQKRIAAILDKADSLHRKRQQAICLADDFLRAVFLDMFGDPVTNPKGWPIEKLSNLCDVATGATPSRDVPSYFDGPHPWIKTGEVDSDWIVSAEERISDSAIAETNCKLFPPQTILVAMYGQGKTRGKVGMLGIPAATNQACAAILPSSKVNSEFLFSQLRMSYEALREMGRGGNQENLNLGMIKTLDILRPPTELVSKYSAIRKQLKALSKPQQEVETYSLKLAASLQAEFFR